MVYKPSPLYRYRDSAQEVALVLNDWIEAPLHDELPLESVSSAALAVTIDTMTT